MAFCTAHVPGTANSAQTELRPPELPDPLSRLRRALTYIFILAETKPRGESPPPACRLVESLNH